MVEVDVLLAGLFDRECCLVEFGVHLTIHLIIATSYVLHLNNLFN